MSSTWDCSDCNPERMAALEEHYQRTRSITPSSSHTRGDSDLLDAMGAQFRPPVQQTSWPRPPQLEIAHEDLIYQHPVAGDLAFESANTTPRPRPGRGGHSRRGSRSTPHLPSFARYQPCSREDVAILITQRDMPQGEVASNGPLRTASPDSWRGNAPSMSEDHDVDGARTPTQASRAHTDFSYPRTPPPRSVTTTEDGRGSIEEGPISPPWSPLKRKRETLDDGHDNEPK